MVKPSILIACIGNIFLGDDAFGVEVAKHLMAKNLPEEIKVVDFGIRGIDLVYTLLDKWDLTIFVDAISKGETPGTIYVIEPDLNELSNSDQAPIVEAHNLDPLKALSLAKSMGAELKNILLVGCEPLTFGLEQEDTQQQLGQFGQFTLSEPVQASITKAILLIESLATKRLLENCPNLPT